MPDLTHSFRSFSKLPAEVRLLIWHLCLPNRVCELDSPIDQFVWRLPSGELSPCILDPTTCMNKRPPVITRVCRESRAAAFETGRVLCLAGEDIPSESRYSRGRSVAYTWCDYTRDSVHLNWTPDYEMEYRSAGNAIKSLIWHSSKAIGGGSIMSEHFGSWGTTWTDRKQRYETIGQFPNYVVIMQTVVVHMDFASASVTGLFGLLCDAPVQVVNVSEQARINAFYKLAEDRKRKRIVTKVQQDLRREPQEWYERSLRHAKNVSFAPEDKAPTMQPAIMFRLCTHNCDRIGYLGRNPITDKVTYTTARARARQERQRQR